jgi:signal transduction histidine kinase/ActR/RegA family two-component response regulator
VTWFNSISGRLGSLFMVIALIPVIIVVVITNIVFTKTVLQERSEALSAVADATRDRIEDYIHTRITDVNTVSMLAIWQSVLASEEHVVSPPSHVRTILEAYISEKEYYDLLLIDLRGIVRYSILTESDLGQNIYEYPLSETQLPVIVDASNTLLQTEVSKFSYYPPTGGYAAFFASPIFSDGIIIGTVVLQVDQIALNQIINRYQGLGESGDILTAGVTDGGLIITSASRHEPGLFGRIVSSDAFWPFTEALEGSQGGSIYVDHRDREVLAEWRYLPSMNWGLITKIDTSELYAPINDFARTSMLILLLSVLLALAGTFISYQQISGPLTRFASAVRSLRKNDLPESLPVQGRFEIAELGHSFNELVADIRTYQKDLEAMVDERTRDLQLALDRAEQANRAKGTFLATMSHEIRTPLNGVIGFTELLKSTPLDEIQQEYVRHAQTSGNTLLGIINDVLDLSKIEAGGLELEIQRRDIVALAREMTDVVKYQAESKGIKLLLDIPSDLPCMADVDDVRLRQICVNLLGNAIKFTNKGEIELKIRFERTRSDRGRYSFAVRDTGIGIKPDQKEKLFEAFSQGDSSTSRKYGGTGLGLTISRLLVEKMGGNMSVQSEFGKGSVFSFDLETTFGEPEPLGVAPEMDYGKTTVSKSILKEGENVTILLAEDVDLNMMLVKAMLEWLLPGVRIYGATDGLQACVMAGKHDLDLILMDINMPLMDGFDATKKIRELEANTGRRIPIVALTAGVMVEDRKMAIESGMDDFLTKPIDYDKLVGVLKTWLKDKVVH